MITYDNILQLLFLLENFKRCLVQLRDLFKRISRSACEAPPQERTDLFRKKMEVLGNTKHCRMLQISFPFFSHRFFIIFYVVILYYHAQHCPTCVKLKTLFEIGGRVRFGAGLRSCFWLPQWQHAEGPNGLGSCHPLWKVFLNWSHWHLNDEFMEIDGNCE
jgi:hypothetical protein